MICRPAVFRDYASCNVAWANCRAWSDLEETLRCLARDFDEIADDIETGATQVRHPELSRWAL
jgi:hypothetical protein